VVSAQVKGSGIVGVKMGEQIVTELREMLRRGDTSISTKVDNGSNKNNWVFSSAPKKAHNASGGVDGTLTAKLASTTRTIPEILRITSRLLFIHSKTNTRVMIFDVN
jgi:hypothetical protein